MGKRKKIEIAKAWEDYKIAVNNTKAKSEDDFEKYLNLLATGGIVLGFTFMEKIFSLTTISHIYTMLFGLVCLVFTLVLNLFSHFKSIEHSNHIINEIDNKDYDNLIENTVRRNKFLGRLNKMSIFLFFVGTLLIMIFVVINLYNINEEKMNEKPQVVNKVDIPDNSSGRTNPSPPSVKPKK
ncbi:hypothetical protein ACKLNQ_11970 [Myroides odoratimimus]|uniref:hypothetical protein n=1 Tax=Myroides odoratimimus TaxID=76832 RepID=UPI0038D421A0